MSSKILTPAEVHNELIDMKRHADAINSSVSTLWESADRDTDYHAYTLNTEMSAIYRLNKAVQETLDDLIPLIADDLDLPES